MLKPEKNIVKTFFILKVFLIQKMNFKNYSQCNIYKMFFKC